MIDCRTPSAVCNEAIRIHPILSECACADRAVEIGSNHPGRSIHSIAGIHYDPATFRSRTSSGRGFIERTFSKMEFMPFGSGHRRCLGGAPRDTMRIATAEAVLITSRPGSIAMSVST